jgi:hypothetical protein
MHYSTKGWCREALSSNWRLLLSEGGVRWSGLASEDVSALFPGVSERSIVASWDQAGYGDWGVQEENLRNLSWCDSNRSHPTLLSHQRPWPRSRHPLRHSLVHWSRPTLPSAMASAMHGEFWSLHKHCACLDPRSQLSPQVDQLRREPRRVLFLSAWPRVRYGGCGSCA